jgi:hypothetical protein
MHTSVSLQQHFESATSVSQQKRKFKGNDSMNVPEQLEYFKGATQTPA